MADPQQIYAELSDPIEQFFETYYDDFVTELRHGFDMDDATVWINWGEIHTWNTDVAEDFLTAQQAFREVFERVLNDLDGRESDADDIRVRVFDLPDDRTYEVGDTRDDQLNTFIGVRGQIAKVTDSRLKFTNAAFCCQRCGTVTDVPQAEHGFQEPHQCEGCERQGPFKLDPDQSESYDQRLIQLQEPPEQADGDASTLTVVVSGDLEDWLSNRRLSAGSRVTVNGVLTLDNNSSSDDWGTFDTYLDAESIEIEEQDYEEIDVEEHRDEIESLSDDPTIYERLIDSLAPTITGSEKIRNIKLAVILQLFGGYRRKKPDGSYIRGDSHILLIGDPATGKSSIMDAVEEIAPRVSRASGKGSTAAGLTASAVRDNDFGDEGFTLEAGALALADKGVACIDEIDKMREDSLESIHSALEQQRVHVHKGGINATIPTRTALLAAGNPTYGRFDEHEPFHEQHDLDPALFSRFDLAFALVDTPDPERDGTIASQKTEMWRETAKIDRDEMAVDDAEASAPDIDQETLRAYIAYARQNHKPVLTEAAAAEIQDYYTGIREQWSGSDDSIPITPRVMDAMRRLSEAAARVRLSDDVTVDDVERIKPIIGQTLADFGLNEDGEFDADIVETGQSATQRQRVKSILSLVEEADDEFDDGVPIDTVKERAENTAGIDPELTEREIEKLMQKGDLYTPNSDTVRPI